MESSFLSEPALDVSDNNLLIRAVMNVNTPVLVERDTEKELSESAEGSVKKESGLTLY